MLKRPELTYGFQGSIFKGQVREGSCRVCDQLLHNSLIDWWWGSRAVSQGLTLIRWLQSVWGPCAHGHHVINFFHLVGALVSVKQFRKVRQILLSMYFREELKILWLPYGWLFKLLPVHLAQLLLLSLHVHIFSITDSWASLLWLRGGLGDYSFSKNKRQAEDMRGGVCPGKVPKIPAQLQYKNLLGRKLKQWLWEWK